MRRVLPHPTVPERLPKKADANETVRTPMAIANGRDRNIFSAAGLGGAMRWSHSGGGVFGADCICLANSPHVWMSATARRTAERVRNLRADTRALTGDSRGRVRAD